MKTKLFLGIILGMGLIFGSVGPAMAALITFSEEPLGTSDPLINSVQFFAGAPNADPLLTADTATDDWWTPGDPYLLSGFDDGTGASPNMFDTFIGAEAQGFLFDAVTVDVLSEMFLPDSTDLTLAAVSGGAIVDSFSWTMTDNSYQSMSVSFATGFDTVWISDDLDDFGFGEFFHIDNFAFTEYTNGTQPVPEPATILLTFMGLGGLAALRRKIKIS